MEESYNPADMVKFNDFCELLEDLNKCKTGALREEKLIKFINDIRMVAVNRGTKLKWTFFPILRLLLPQLDRERAAYNLKEVKLGQLLVKVLGIHKQSTDGKKLLNFRSVPNSGQGNDFASVAYFVLMTRGTGSESLTIKDINDNLDKLASTQTENKGVILDEVFSFMIRNATAKENKWFLRIVLKDLKLHMGTKRILATFHPDAPEIYDVCNNLLKVCEELDEGSTRPLEFGLQLFTPVSPMLSEKLDIADIAQLSKDATYQIEIKFDGERFQIHMDDGKFEYFSRRGFNYTDKYGKTYDSDGMLTPDLKNCFAPGVQSFILDGEMMGWHKQLRCFSSKGMAFDVKKITENSKFRPCFCAFDILYYNGKPLVGLPDKGGISLHERQRILDDLFKDIPGVLYHSKKNIVETGADIIKALKDANTKGEEGIVLKDIGSYYVANSRKAGWYKLKPEYSEGTMEDLDLVIIGGEYAENKKQGIVRSFLVALAADDDPNSGHGARRWLLVGRVATGLSFEERERLCALLEPHWKPLATHSAPACLVWNKEKPDLWVHPDNSYVLQVRATELIRSVDFAAEYTLRFPRVQRIREDKPVTDILTLDEFNKIIKAKTPVIKLSTGQVNVDNVEIGSSMKTRKRKAQVLEVASHFRKTEQTEEKPTSRALLGRKLCVLSDSLDCPKQQLEKIIYSHSGVVVQNTAPDVWCCVAGQINARVNCVIEDSTFNVVSALWLKSLPESDEPCALPRPIDFIAMTFTTRAELALKYDKFGDSYTEQIDEAVLRECFDRMDFDELPNVYLTTGEMLDLDEELFDGASPYSFLRSCFIHNYNENTHNISLLKAKIYGAKLSKVTSPNLTHILVSEDTELKEILELKTTAPRSVVVKQSWLEECFAQQKLVDTTCN